MTRTVNIIADDNMDDEVKIVLLENGQAIISMVAPSHSAAEKLAEQWKNGEYQMLLS